MHDLTPENLPEQTPEQPVSGCLKCSTPFIEEGHAMPLCSDCRTELSKFPFPRWLYLFAGAIGLVFVVSLFRFPGILSSQVHVSRGIKAEEQHKFLTATEEYKIAEAECTDNATALAHLFIINLKSENISEAITTFQKLIQTAKDNKLEDEDLTNEVNKYTTMMEKYYLPAPELSQLLAKQDSIDHKAFVDSLRQYQQANPNLPYARYILASTLFDDKQYNEVISLIENETDYTAAEIPAYIGLKAAAYRELLQFDEATECCNRALQINSEDASTYAALAKISLKKHDDVQALTYVNKAIQLDSSDITSIISMALVKYYQGKKIESEKHLLHAKSLAGNDRYIKKYEDIISGIVQWR